MASLSKKTSRKGEVTDVMIWMITIFILACGFFVIMYVVPPIADGLRTAGLNGTVPGADSINSMESISLSTINTGFLLLFIGLIASVLITSFLVRTHPIFLFLYVFFLGISLILGVYLGNTYYDLQNNPIFSNILNDARFINLVMNHIVEITLAVGALSMIIVFGKFSTYGGQQQF